MPLEIEVESSWAKSNSFARALIKLGLGPNYSSELLNAPPKTASAGAPSATASRGIEGTAAKQ